MNLENASPPTIRRLNKNDTKEELVQQVHVSHYNGPKKSDMPERFATRAVLPLNTRLTVYHTVEGTSARPRVSSEDNL